MHRLTRTAVLVITAVAACAAARHNNAGELPAIGDVTIQPNGAFHVNGRPFFPLMAWLQNAENLPSVKETGMNTTAGYWPGSDKSVVEYLRAVQSVGLYGVMPFDKRLKGHPSLLGYIHGDEPDLPHQESDAKVVAAAQLRINRSTPLWKLVDGVTHSWSVLDPLVGSELTIQLPRPVTVKALAVWITFSGNLPVAKEVVFFADGRELVRATLERKKGRQQIPLASPATFRELSLKVVSAYPGEQVWGSLGEIEGFDSSGKNVLLAAPRYVPRAAPDKTLAEYRAIKAFDTSRPVFMTITGNFHPFFKKWSSEERRALYPQYVAAADVVGYDIYPIYGYNKPEWIYLGHDATAQLKSLAGSKPVYAWIETSKGGKYTGPLERQKDVTPRHIRAEVWMAICRGATAIGYFTHIWKPSYKQFGVPEENRRALRAINDQITRLAPAILAAAPDGEVLISGTDDTKLDIMARRFAGAIYLFAVNYDGRDRGTSATITVPGLAAGTTIEVLDEQRSISSSEGQFLDDFQPLDVHIYRLPERPVEK